MRQEFRKLSAWCRINIWHTIFDPAPNWHCCFLRNSPEYLRHFDREKHYDINQRMPTYNSDKDFPVATSHAGTPGVVHFQGNGEPNHVSLVASRCLVVIEVLH